VRPLSQLIEQLVEAQRTGGRLCAHPITISSVADIERSDEA
jgi:hypothetical protein